MIKIFYFYLLMIPVVYFLFLLVIKSNHNKYKNYKRGNYHFGCIVGAVFWPLIFVGTICQIVISCLTMLFRFLGNLI
jgi:hypothetical protein